MNGNPFNFKNKKDREDFWIAIPVILFFGWLLYYFGWSPNRLDAFVDNEVAQVEIANPDLDADGVPNHLDLCPEAPGLSQNDGCPKDTDGDGINDRYDKCPEKYGQLDNAGCPEEVEVGSNTRTEVASKIPRSYDSAVANAGRSGGADTVADQDGDGIADKEDLCPNLAGVAANKGCPLDSDGDGVYDKDDACPNEKGIFTNKGCPRKIADRDGDGVPDNVDNCPDEAGDVTNVGCPKKAETPAPPSTPAVVEKPIEMTKEEEKLVANAVTQVVFLPASANLTEYSKGLVKKLSGIMKKYPNAKLRISGHTDSLGDDAANLQLSKDRAMTCLNLLATYGIDRSRMTSDGFGETKPIAPNNTKAGRQKNRRVEFVLYEK